MTLQELRYIVALADAQHFGRAAEACCVGQSTLSTGLKKIEDRLGTTLFDRSLRSVRPTPAAREIIESARRIVMEADRIRELARSAKDPMDRTVRLGVIPTLAPYYLPHVLGRLHRTYPRLRLLLREELTPRLLTDLGEGRLDAGLLALPVTDPAIEVAPLFREPFLAAVPRGHRLAKRARIGLDELADAGLLLLEEGHCLRSQALQACRLEAIQSEETRATSLETLRQMVGLGLGVTLIPALAAPMPKGSRGQIACKPLDAPGANRRIGLIWRKRSPVEAAMAKLAQTLADHLPPGVSSPD